MNETRKREPNEDDRISVVHSREEDSPRAENDVGLDEEPLTEEDLETSEEEKDEAMELDPGKPIKRARPTDEPADIFPRSERSGDEVAAVDQPDADTLAEYEREAERDRRKPA
jgi:hypothetical protein